MRAVALCPGIPAALLGESEEQVCRILDQCEYANGSRQTLRTVFDGKTSQKLATVSLGDRDLTKRGVAVAGPPV